MALVVGCKKCPAFSVCPLKVLSVTTEREKRGTRGRKRTTERNRGLFPLGLTEDGRLVQGEENDLLAGDRTDIVVQGPHLGARDIFDHRFHDRPCCFDQMRPNLLEQISSLLGWQRLDEMLFGRGQNAKQANNQLIVDQVSANVPRATAHVLLFETDHPGAHGGFDFPLCFHNDLHGTGMMMATRRCSATNHSDSIPDLLPLPLRVRANASFIGGTRTVAELTPAEIPRGASRDLAWTSFPPKTSQKPPQTMRLHFEATEASHCLFCSDAYDCTDGRVAAQLIAAFPTTLSDD